MNPAEYFSPLPNTHAKDEEIKRYAGLLDSLGIGLVVFYPDASPCLSNKVASKLIGNTPPNWVNESGQIICADELPLKRVLRTSKPVFRQLPPAAHFPPSSNSAALPFMLVQPTSLTA